LGHGVRAGPLLLRTDREVPRRAWVFRPGAAGRPEPAGALDDAALPRCAAAYGYLACPLTDGRFTVLPYAPG
jgi:hypothetical protein